MENNKIRILAVETSCDETAAAVIGIENESPIILSNIVSSQADLHAKTGGVVPEVASRAHMEAILPVIEEALMTGISNSKLPHRVTSKIISNKTQSPNIECQNKDLLEGITHIAVTNSPGLIGSLLVGFNAAKTIAYSRDLPFLPINHIEGHIYSAYAESISNDKFLISKQIPHRVTSQTSSKFQNSNLAIKQLSNEPKFPILALTVSGGHTSLTLMKDHGVYETIGETIDDAAGEAFDKVAKLLGLPYPGGPEVSRMADVYRKLISNECQNPNDQCQIKFPRPLINQPNFDFSFSGLKTAVLTYVKKLQTTGYQLQTSDIEEICFAFEEATVDVLCTKAIKAARKYRPKGLLLAGGVAANSRLREELKIRTDKYNEEVEAKNRIKFYLPGKGMAGDNAAMIGIAAYYHIQNNDISELFSATVDSNSSL